MKSFKQNNSEILSSFINGNALCIFGAIHAYENQQLLLLCDECHYQK